MTLLVFLTGLISVSDARPPRNNPDDAFSELEGQTTLYFFDAVNGKPVADATITFNGKTATTDADGQVQFPTLSDVGAGEQTLSAQFKKSGYVSTEIPIEYMSGSVWFNRYSVTRTISMDSLRIVLDWSDSPQDLDAHLIKQDSYHISYRDMKSYEDLAVLDRDDRDGWGAETITMQRLQEDGVYRYYIVDYTNQARPTNQALSASKAHVRVYSNNGLEHTFVVPPKQTGTIWEVFTIKDGQLTPVNTFR
jgi:hypothetical protein